MALVSVIIPLYNQSTFLTDAINSVLFSTYKNIEIIVVNDGSTDISEAELRECIPQNVILINQSNQGVCAARNNGISKANGEYILTLDADDKVHPEFIQKAVSVLDNNSDIGIVYAKAEYFGNTTGEWFFPEFKKTNMLVDNLIPSFAMFRKTSWVQAGGYKPEMENGGEDWEFWVSLIENGEKAYRFEETLLYYRRHSQSKTAKNYENLHWDIFKKIMLLHPKLYSDNITNIAFPLFFRVFKGLEFNRQMEFVIKLVIRAVFHPITKIINRRNLRNIKSSISLLSLKNQKIQNKANSHLPNDIEVKNGSVR